MNLIHAIWPLLVLVLWSASVAANEETEILYLLDQVATSGCTFERNGSSHDSADAADHLRLKYRRGKRYASSAEQFIDRLATESSWTGKPYTITCDDVTEPSAKWLHEALQQYRQEPTEPTVDSR